MASLLNQSSEQAQYVIISKINVLYPFPVSRYILYRKITFVFICLVACYWISYDRYVTVSYADTVQ